MMDHDASASAHRLLREEDCDPRLPFLFHHINLSNVGENGDHSPVRVEVDGLKLRQKHHDPSWLLINEL